MATFFVGQRVRLVVSQSEENIGSEGCIVATGSWTQGDLLPNGAVLGHGSSDLLVDWGSAKRTLNGRFDRITPIGSERVEPILPEGQAPSLYSFQELMDKCREGVAA